MKLLATFLSLALTLQASAGLKVATLHPLLNDLARNVGGQGVTVVSLLPDGGDPHSFSPTPATMSRLTGCDFVLASGKGLEAYLGKLQDNLPSGTRIIETGKKIPSLKIEEGALFVCCPHHNHGMIDPHWWHSPKSVARAARYLAGDFAKADPENAAAYKANAKAFGAKMDVLASWAKKTLSAIPKADRELATAHAAFGYFCRDFGFRALPVQGLDNSRESSPSYLKKTLEAIREHEIRAVFPEVIANPKTLRALAKETGVKVGGSLDADATTPGVTYESLMRKNVATIVSGLR